MKINSDLLDKIDFFVGNSETLEKIPTISSKPIFDEDICSFFYDLSKDLISDNNAKKYPDIVSFAFWIRKSSINNLKKRFDFSDNLLHLGRGVAFHIAPSNVPVNFAYTLAVGLLTGNTNIVRLPSKNFEQVKIITASINRVLKKHEDIKSYMVLIKYPHDTEINDYLSCCADTRIIWGGDNTIEELRKSPLPARSKEITFANRYSLAIVNSDIYLNISDKKSIAESFYNDTYIMDQNACTSPKIIIWIGNRINEAKSLFWSEARKIIESKYNIHAIQCINKLTSSYLASVALEKAKIILDKDNLIVRINISDIKTDLLIYLDNSGYFFEYDCHNIMDLFDICNDKRCQTIAFVGDRKMLKPLFENGIKGVDRIVEFGHTMDFDLIWDGYNLVSELTRTIMI